MTKSASREVAILGVGMHPWGKWGRNFVEYGIDAAHKALDDAGLEWSDVDSICGADTIRNGYPGYVAGATFAQALGWTGAPVTSCYAACASGAQALNAARTQILAGMADVALVVGADTTPKGFFKPNPGERYDDPDWLRFRLVGATNPTYFGLYARRRMDVFGATEDDFAKVRVKAGDNSVKNPNARYQKQFTVDEVLASPMVADPLRLLEICATSDGGAAVVIASMDYARRVGRGDAPKIAGIATTTPTYPSTVLEMPDLATDSAMVVDPPSRRFRAAVAFAAYEQAGISPSDVGLAEVYDLSAALELDWMEDLGLCAEGTAEELVREGATRIDGAIPVNPSGGLLAFGEAIPAQALAQVCELTWQIRGQAGDRQVAGATVGVTANQGLFGHGSSVVVTA